MKTTEIYGLILCGIAGALAAYFGGLEGLFPVVLAQIGTSLFFLTKI